MKCTGCGEQIKDAEIAWCTRCAPEDERSGTRYSDLIPQ